MKKLLVIVGPTGTGKTGLALDLAKKFSGEIISADSRQVYKGMDIGTGKLDLQSTIYDVSREKGKWVIDGVPIYLYDIIDPDKNFSMAEYQQLAYTKINEAQSRKKLPILVGGSGLYVRSVVQGLKVPQVKPDKKIREKLAKKSLGTLLGELEKVDPKMYLGIDKSNQRRIIRALEVYHKTGKPMSTLAKKYQPDFDVLQFGLTAPREILYKDADERIDNWINRGFVEEVRELLQKYDSTLPSMSSLGYRQIIAYLNKKISLDEAVKRIKFDHHGYIRRQLTWFKKEPNLFWFYITDSNFKEEISRSIRDWLKN